MSLWAMTGDMIGRGFSQGFDSGWDKTNRNFEEERRQQRALQLQKDLMNFKLEQQKQEETRNAKELGSLWDMVTGKNQFEDNLVKPQINMFQQPQNSTPIPLQEAQASPNNNNNNYSSVLLGDSIINGANPLTQETLNAGTQNYRNAFNNWKQNKPYTDEQWALGKALNEGIYAPYPLMLKEIDKILNPAPSKYDTLNYFDPKTNLFMAVQTKNGIPVGDPYPVDKWKSGSSGKFNSTPVDKGYDGWYLMDEYGNIVKDLGISPKTINDYKNFFINQNKIDKNETYKMKDINNGAEALRKYKDRHIADMFTRDVFNSVPNLANQMKDNFYNLEDRKYNDWFVWGNRKELTDKTNDIINSIDYLMAKDPALIYEIVPQHILNIPQIQKYIREGLGEEVGNNLSKMERGKETIVTLR